MLFRDQTQQWVLEAVAANGGEASIIETAKGIWQAHQRDLVSAGDHFYTWQYDMRWAAQRLREKNRLKLRSVGSRSVWYL